MSKIDIGTVIDLDDLIESRMLIQANSGGGKSGVARVTMEECVGKVPFIVLDKKGEYYTLKEKFNDILIIGGRNGDIPISMQAAPKLAQFIIGHQLTVVIDMSLLESDNQRADFIASFLKGMMNLGESYWKYYLVFVEEAHVWCGQQDKMSSGRYIKLLMSEGRKMGYCGILITQRISKLHKDAAAECNNKFIGRTFLDLDINRSAAEMGLVGQEKLKLRELKPRHFWAFGTSIQPHHVHEVVIKEAKTKFVKAGVKINLSTKPPTDKIKKALAKLNELPAEAAKELNDIKELQAEVKKLNLELKKKSAVPTTVAAPADDKLKLQVAQLQADLKEERRFSAELKKATDKININVLKAKELLDIRLDIKPAQLVPLPKDFIPFKNIVAVDKSGAIHQITPKPISGGSGEMRMLKAAAMFHPNTISRTRMGAFARLSHTSGSFGTYVSSLKTSGYLVGGPQEFTITPDGLAAAGDVPALPSDPQELINLWCGIIGESSGAARMLRVLGENYPTEMSKEQLGEAVSMTHTSGSFGTYLSYLRSRGLIKTTGKTVVASGELFL